jgi:ribonuclease P protein component
MLPQRHRLRRRKDVIRVREYGKPWRHPLAILLVLKAEPGRETLRLPAVQESDMTAASPSRFAFTASRRVGSAVVRNRGKRLLREAVREEIARIEPGWDCLFIVREATPQADFGEVKKAVSNLLRRAQLIAKPQAGM